MQRLYDIFNSVPGWLALTGIAFELLLALFRRKRLFLNVSALQFAAWALRPWVLWGVFNLVFRWNWERGFNNRRTFPFFANLWSEKETFAEAVSRILNSPGVPVWSWVVLGVLLVMTILLMRFMRREAAPVWPALAGLYILAIALHLSQGSLPAGAWPRNDNPGSLLSSAKANTGMLYTMSYVHSAHDYLSRFLEIQPRLRTTIHGVSHPPGASLTLYWIGKVFGVETKDIRCPENRLRYTLGLTVFGALNVFILFLLGRALFDARTGFLAATLWAAAPSVSAYATFAQDAIYALFFNLALLLSWQTVMSEKRAKWFAVVLGADFFAMTMLNYSWCIMTTVFSLFALFIGIRKCWLRKEYAVRVFLPLVILAALLAGFLAFYRLDYLAMYRFSRQYVDQWYCFTGAYQWIMALIGGQMDLFLLMGSVTCSAFFAAAARFRKRHLAEPRVIFVAILFCVYTLPILFGPTCLKMEAARCWNWIATLPFVFAAAKLMKMPGRIFVYGAPAVSVLTYTLMRLFLNFAP